ncbi:O-methyltransferase-domain-containing protein [Xylaria arbuscula]|nr:O-methyltransferase-domain-containing protein [Xylaria arbuscula]
MNSDNSLTQIEHLAATISKSVAKLREVLAKEGVPSPSFAENAGFVIPQEGLDFQDAILDATAELHDLMLDPLILIREHGGHNNSACLQFIGRFGIANMVPSEGRVSFSEIALQTGLPEDIVCRFLRHAMTMRIFREPEPGIIGHTAASKLLCNPSLADWLRVGTEEIWPSSVKMLDALQTWPNSFEPHETGFSLANSNAGSIYQLLASDSVRAARFSNAMKAFSTSSLFSISHLTDNYDWASLGAVEVIDIGGAQGHVALELSKRFEQLKVTVQDIDEVVRYAGPSLPPSMKGKVHFMAHDLFAPQTLQADIFIFRWVLHNWSDKHCILILRAQIPALKPNAKIIIQEACIPEPGTSALWREKYARADDLSMAAIFNSRERTVDEWRKLLSVADSRFMMKRVIHPKGSMLAILEIIWDPSN